MSLFRVENGTFIRNQRIIFKGINFTIDKSEVLAILGRNGVGKTTLIQCCMGFLKWADGASYLQNRAVETISHQELFSKISYIPQAKNLKIGLKVLDMILLGFNTKITTIPKKEHIDKANEIMEDLEIMHLAQKTCDCLSGGELQMVIFARALVNEPLLIVLDEPESNLDFKNQDRVLKTLEFLKKKGKSVIINTHYPQNAQRLADKILIMHKNRDCIIGDKQLINKRQLSKSFEVDRSFFEYMATL
ncbi:TPA: ABC transporter ATP-binding protein [Campylobacter coli]|uniref:ABC transporter ATP-binding protein n=2 Tax=Campylobacter coli TaxID=195 RepID=UPI0006ACE87B|nr:ABC transporter ATP-binding protein [Campylobacter coli]MCW1332447.1 ABC transporter ATP-binding protein [Campylobacter jejuni]MCW1352268.1 ABC transporter ATP-binding protein [Campylobacter jejuni]HEB9286870.1 ABC transporter ATP-binding protein [Campylobacter coli]HEB9313369.1 ABC transporter ATP-binding protein [Campylobacter coli]HEB9345073.1 ABC transporter ATP-binding protein [Campylobacter coli]